MHMDFASLSKKYGEVFAFHLGPQKHVVVSGAKSIKEVPVEKGTHFAGRPLENIKLDIASTGYKDMLAADYGPRFKFMRKVFARGLNLHGFNKMLIHDTIVKHADATIAHTRTKFDRSYTICKHWHCKRYNANGVRYETKLRRPSL